MENWPKIWRISSSLRIWVAATPLWSGEFRRIDGRDFPKMGMFAAANQILGQLALYETKQPVEIEGLLVDFDVLGLYYDPARDPNWWNYYFEPIWFGSENRSLFISPSKAETCQAFRKRRELSRAQASELAKKYIHVRKEIVEKANFFAFLHFRDFFMMGVHYRGTDKRLEAPRVPYEVVFEAIINQIPQDRMWQIFAATDELPFLKALQEKFPDKVIFSEARRSENEEGVHFSREEPYRLGEEALIDALLLSKCDRLIRTSSNLSLWSTYFNPDLQTTLLSQSFESLKNVEAE